MRILIVVVLFQLLKVWSLLNRIVSFIIRWVYKAIIEVQK